MNSIGWSDFSAVTTQLVAEVPGKLDAPTLLDVTDTSIHVALDTNVDDGGSVVTLYNLQIN